MKLVFAIAFVLFFVRSCTSPPAPLAILSESVPVAFVGESYQVQLEASGGTAPYKWSLLSGAIPPGITFGISGTLAGIPSSAGAFEFIVQVQDSSNNFAVKKISTRRSP